MLRGVIGAIGALCAVAGLLLLLSPSRSGLFLIIIGALIVLSLIFEGRYRAASSNAQSWQSTGEKFIDPGSGEVIEVDYDPQTGERRYRQDQK
jgi:hypothetical protein